MIIYLTTNLVNGKIYVGKDQYNKPTYLGSGKVFVKALRKYGKENFKKEIIEVCNENNWDKREAYWIKRMHSKNPSIGYNLCSGGRGISGYTMSKKARIKMAMRKLTNPVRYWEGKKFSDEYRKKLSDAHKGIPLTEKCKKNMSISRKGKHFWTDEMKKKMSSARMGKGNPMYGKKRSVETRKKVSLALTGKRLSDSHRENISKGHVRRIRQLEEP